MFDTKYDFDDEKISELNDIAMSLGYDSAYKQALYLITEKIPSSTEEVREKNAVHYVRMAVKYNTTIDYVVANNIEEGNKNE